MKTSEFIEMLRKADPSGECHIRMPGGIPTFAERKEGYWDGPYSYINEEGYYVYSTARGKVDIHCMDVYDFVEHNTDKNTTWEEIQDKFIFELSYCFLEQKQQRADSILKMAKEAYDNEMEFYEKLNDNK